MKPLRPCQRSDVAQQQPVAQQPFDAAPLVVELRGDLVPAAVLLADQVARVDAYVLEEGLVEVVLAGHVHDRRHGDAGGAHVDEELADALVLRRLRIGARHQVTVVGLVREADPDLVAVDDVRVTVLDGVRLAARPDRSRRSARSYRGRRRARRG